ncbi:uncharacterized protein LOC123192901 [Mangifera indica]|uniref:uncharacterized protein LOC123192901 n=1 Tax=Mangifera indica TaxID=29780 RepID=UPI001CFAC231|nr:uncharacterized protein LOC123192901 [Mangifera indica]
MVTTMADFPPNPEDGELWIPSEIIHEITSAHGTVSPPPKHTVLSHHPPRPTLPPVAPNFQICFGSFGVNQSGVHPDVVGSPTPCSSHNTVTRVVQGFDKKGSSVYVEKNGGTGVFLPLPRSVNTCAKPDEIASNPGVSTQKKKRGVKKGGGSNEKMTCSSLKKGIPAKKEQYRQLPSGICLPQDWKY